MWKLTALIGLIATPAMAQVSPCAPRDVVVERLKSEYSETRQSVGLTSTGIMVEVFASIETGTWTITRTNASGQTCLLVSGHYHQKINDDLPKGDGL